LLLRFGSNDDIFGADDAGPKSKLSSTAPASLFENLFVKDSPDWLEMATGGNDFGGKKENTGTKSKGINDRPSSDGNPRKSSMTPHILMAIMY